MAGGGKEHSATFILFITSTLGRSVGSIEDSHYLLCVSPFRDGLDIRKAHTLTALAVWVNHLGSIIQSLGPTSLHPYFCQAIMHTICDGV